MRQTLPHRTAIRHTLPRSPGHREGRSRGLIIFFRTTMSGCPAGGFPRSRLRGQTLPRRRTIWQSFPLSQNDVAGCIYLQQIFSTTRSFRLTLSGYESRRADHGRSHNTDEADISRFYPGQSPVGSPRYPDIINLEIIYSHSLHIQKS